MQPGAFLHFHPLTWQDYQVFEKSYGKLSGVGYIPHAVSTQVVSGAINYRFLCTQTILTEEPIVNIVIVDINDVTVTETKINA